ncbi:FxLYD domain-containing protein [Natronolimnohabitans innermongolicus]|uniref:CARDB domain-containing protein n=1 Tax=Natronolimnohabitans innermongolicus JCM 12255 TaxID=1227499 RepID=L9X713_9EURY|nr:FxLYD domain-containing protein [Natronolimnohabitans innermongolicus]ELY57392.1 hypothetical protein C493_07901 [Natronolimnohabitans innermongolicus JCM 12255]
MDRRRFLLGSGTALSALVAGCASETEEMDGSTRNGDDDGNENGNENGNGGDGSSDSADLAIVDHELVVERGTWSTDVYVEATVENRGGAASGELSLQADWYDESGNYLDNDTARLSSLEGGETWSARIYHFGSDSEDVDGYELEGDFSDDLDEAADGLTLVTSEMTVTGDDISISGEVENESDDDQRYVEVIAKIYDGDGVVLGDEWTNVTDLRAGETWAFSIPHISRAVRERASDAADHDIRIETSSW